MLVCVGEHRVEAVAAFEVPARALLLRVAGNQRRVQINCQLARGASELPNTRPRSRVSEDATAEGRPGH